MLGRMDYALGLFSKQLKYWPCTNADTEDYPLLNKTSTSGNGSGNTVQMLESGPVTKRYPIAIQSQKTTEKSKKQRFLEEDQATQDLYNLLTYKVLSETSNSTVIKTLIYLVVFAVSTWQLILSVSWFAVTKTTSTFIVRVLVFSVLPLVFCFVLKSITCINVCANRAVCNRGPHKMSIAADEDSGLLDSISLCQLLITILLLVTVWAYSTRADKIGEQPVYVKSFEALKSFALDLDSLSMPILLAESQLIFHVLYLETTYASQFTCRNLWMRRWGTMEKSLNCVLISLFVSAVAKLYEMLGTVMPPDTSLKFNKKLETSSWIEAVLTILVTWILVKQVIIGQLLLLFGMWVIITLGLCGHVMPTSSTSVMVWSLLTAITDIIHSHHLFYQQQKRNKLLIATTFIHVLSELAEYLVSA